MELATKNKNSTLNAKISGEIPKDSNRKFGEEGNLERIGEKAQKLDFLVRRYPPGTIVGEVKESRFFNCGLGCRWNKWGKNKPAEAQPETFIICPDYLSTKNH